MSTPKKTHESFRGYWGGHIASEKLDNGTVFLNGAVKSPDGICEVMSNGLGSGAPFSRFDFVAHGRHHIVTIRYNYTKRGLATVARRLMKEAAK